jgi:hypothetical protein
LPGPLSGFTIAMVRFATGEVPTASHPDYEHAPLETLGPQYKGTITLGFVTFAARHTEIMVISARIFILLMD